MVRTGIGQLSCPVLGSLEPGLPEDEFPPEEELPPVDPGAVFEIGDIFALASTSYSYVPSIVSGIVTKNGSMH